MERILVVSDTHGKTDNVIRLLENVPFTKVFHLGDLVRDAILLQKAFPDIEFHYVRGNNDPYGAEGEKTVKIGDNKMLLCHGHNYSVSSSLLRLSLRAKEAGANLALFGHTHQKLKEVCDGVTLFNPGSTSRPRGGKASAGIIEMDSGYFGIAHYDF